MRIVEGVSTGKYGKLKIQVYAKENVENRIRELQKKL